ncbi:MAG: D-lactate dehydrogenase (cytochrome) [Rhodoglobus sp.]|nr:D-lactate dehydrogenase (cytochrome) [Rhodoglobus sp.]
MSTIESIAGVAARTTDIAGELRAAGILSVDDSALARSLYSSDASLYRIEPRVVVLPQHADEIEAVLRVATQLEVPVTMRGTGTSIAGNAVGPGIIVDVSRHLNRVLEIDPEEGTALVEPGVIQASLQKAVAPFGWRFGPDPSTHNRATIGGMIGNNACGSRALGYGRTSDNVLGLSVIAGSGERLRLGDIDDPTVGSPLLTNLKALVDGNLAVIRTELGQFGRQVSGYSLEHLLPEKQFNVARALVGTEGTLALTTAARLRLVRDAPIRALVVLGYESMAHAADAVPAILQHGPVACEGLDARIVDVVRDRRGPAAVPPLPAGSGWLMVELTGEEPGEVAATAMRLVADAGALDATVVADPRQAAALWRIREDGAGLAGRTPEGKPAHSGWEDAAVPPARLGAYLREFESLLTDYRLTGIPYGHFGDGCVHIRIDFPFDQDGGAGVFRRFLLDAADLVALHGGSMSGEHGDGRARGELLPRMYSPAAISLFSQTKAVFDRSDLLNPGVIVRPAAVDADIRVAAAPPLRRVDLPSLAFNYSEDRGDLSMAVHRCTGVGKCRASSGVDDGSGVMCPSFLATRDEKDSTRGRARVLQDVVSGKLGPAGWRSKELHDALDLCLSCKGCASDCPTGVDMATYKAESLHQKYRHRLRPRAHYSLGWLPRWARLVARATLLTRAANLVMQSHVFHLPITWAAGVDKRRHLPVFSVETFRRWFGNRQPREPGRHGDVVLFVDTFTDSFSPEVGKAAVEVLEHAGYTVKVTSEPVCCGLTWISTGQLDGARRQVTATVRALAPFVHDGALVVGLEPSCTAVLRAESTELLQGDDLIEARTVAAATRTLAELLRDTPGWSPPDLTGVTGVAQPHCHHHAVMGWDADAELLRSAGADLRRLGGCCGLAGNFGVEQGHHDVSVAVAELQLLPAIREQSDGDVLLADGFSCRTQIDSLTESSGEHLAELLARHLPR